MNLTGIDGTVFTCVLFLFLNFAIQTPVLPISVNISETVARKKTLRFVIVVFPDHTYFFWKAQKNRPQIQFDSQCRFTDFAHGVWSFC